jgi:hypothetical protein
LNDRIHYKHAPEENDVCLLQDGEIAFLVREESSDARSWLLLLPSDDLPFAAVGNALGDREPSRALLAHCAETVSRAKAQWENSKDAGSPAQLRSPWKLSGGQCGIILKLIIDSKMVCSALCVALFAKEDAFGF